MNALPVPPLCERCCYPIGPGDGAVSLGHVVGSTLRGDVEWMFTWLHRLEAGACVIARPDAAAA